MERHMSSEFAAKHIYAESLIQKVTLPTRGGLTLAYVVHESDAGTNEDQEESRVQNSGFKSQLKLLSFDNRGSGDSDAPWGRYSTQMMAEDTLALMDHLGWTKAHVVGVSMGGMISQELALKAPERVQSLSLIVTTRGRFIPAYFSLAGIVRSTTSSDPEVITAFMVPFLYPASFLDTPLGKDKTLRNVFYDYHRYGSAARGPMSSAGTLGQSSALMTHYVSDERLLEIQGHGYPILVVGATEDQGIDVLHTRHFQKVLMGDHVRAKIYGNAGHGVFLQCMDEVANDILRVITS